ncbi:MAG TPA: MGMT family protein [Candidatus Paceibacterota bacterium]|nr:MGMT family protein [Candidatus Paceibacterota bacterium]HRY76571.1 MGMT family protein [Candidatus Paceibacterota bacterium]
MGKGFKEKVYQVVAKITKGEVLSYQDVAKKAGSPKACRAVGNIMNRHHIKGLPCHRVIRSDASVGGYFWGTKKKIKRLKEEGVKIESGKVIGFKKRK